MAKLSLSSHFTYKSILRQCLSPILMMIFTSLYVVVDGLFISNINGEDAFAGVNLIFPIIMIVGGIGFMFGSGGAALISKLLGEKNNKKANQVFSMMIYTSFIVVLIVSIIMFFFIEKITISLAKIDPSSTQGMIDNAIKYGKILIFGQPIFAVQCLFHSFFVVDEKPGLGFVETLISGVTNIVFDAILIAGCNLGVEGAAIGTILGYLAGALFALLYFKFSKNNLISFDFCKPDFKAIGKCSTNGASDFIFNISASVVGIIFNAQILKYIGQNGIIAYGVIAYIAFIYLAIYIGLSMGMGPVISYNYGAKNTDELKSVTSKMLNIYFVLALALTALSLALSYPLATLFSKDKTIIDLSTKAMRIYSICFLFSGFSIFITAMFTSLNNGLVSGLLSLFRTLVLEIACVYILPLIMGADGIWWSIVVAEFLSVLISFAFFFAERKKYNY